ncbi:hypothetical protein [Nocardioides sp.]|uniref:hypothetical protein n=1 Tax=Nocardioides sp. TaxID=35761 RepID=UPI002D7E9CF5|nr:hypothetical protein [Nocardioides sp.]HET8960601.1 hypothetical protein [Nocardioides sp.]
MNESNQQLDDDVLLEAISRLWRQVDPPPADLAHGVLARLAAEDLELELMTLVESSDALAGVRSADTVEDSDELTSTFLEYVGPDLRVYVHLSQFDDGTRLDGWVVPARGLTVTLRDEHGATEQRTAVDQHGRFAFARATSGVVRLTFTDEPPSSARPRATPPFHV